MDDRISVNVTKLKYSPISRPLKRATETIQGFLPDPLSKGLGYFIKPVGLFFPLLHRE
jgi:hypothetical protein